MIFFSVPKGPMNFYPEIIYKLDLKVVSAIIFLRTFLQLLAIIMGQGFIIVIDLPVGVTKSVCSPVTKVL